MKREIFFNVLASRLTFIVFAVLAASLVPLRLDYLGNQFDKTAPYLTWIWANFDGRHFLNIATLGYQRFDFAFFPLYPLLISIFGYLFPISHLYLGILVSSLAFLASLFVIYKIIRIDFNENIASTALFFLLFFPLSFFYHSVYSDSLFLLLSTTSFYFARQKRWFLSGIFGGLSTLTRLSGISLVPALVVEWYLQNKLPRSKLRGILASSKSLFPAPSSVQQAERFSTLRNKRRSRFKFKNRKQVLVRFLKKAGVALFLTSLGLFSYMFYLKINFGDWLLFQKAMVAWRQNEFVFPPQVIFRYLKIFLLVDPRLLVYWIAVLEFVSTFAYLALSVYVLRRVRASYGVFMVVLLSLVAFTGTFAGTPRYILHLFPGFIGMGLLFARSKKLVLIVTLLFLIFGFIFTALFTRGYFIT